MFDKILNWIVVSSADPTKVSTTIKGLLLLNASFIIPALQILGLHLTENMYVTDVGMACAVFGALLGIFGLIRKIYLTMTRKEAQSPNVSSLG